MGYDSMQDTLDHKNRVKGYIDDVISELQHRAIVHDNSKLEGVEKQTLDTFVPQLNNLSASDYNGAKYKDIMASMKMGNESHYKNNSHHPEHFVDGVNDMTLLDVIEMVYDWKAACDRKNIDILTTIKSNFERFGISDQLSQIILNTLDCSYKYHITYTCGDNKFQFADNTVDGIRNKINKLINVIPELHLALIKYGPNSEYVSGYDDVRGKSIHNGEGFSVVWEVRK